jgi:hypothetical protein
MKDKQKSTKNQSIKKQISQRLNSPQGLVSSQCKPFVEGTANIEHKLIEKIALLGILYIREFGNAKLMLTGKTKEIENQDIVRVEEECEYMFKILQKSNKVEYIDECEFFNYDNDICAHVETYGRWRFVKKESKRHKLKKDKHA